MTDDSQTPLRIAQPFRTYTDHDFLRFMNWHLETLVELLVKWAMCDPTAPVRIASKIGIMMTIIEHMRSRETTEIDMDRYAADVWVLVARIHAFLNENRIGNEPQKKCPHL